MKFSRKKLSGHDSSVVRQTYMQDNKSTQEETAYDVIYLAACAVNETIPDDNRISKMDLFEVHRLSQSLSLNSLVYMALESACDDLTRNSSFFRKWDEEKDLVIYKNIKFDIQLQQLTNFLTSEGIWYMPLKGVILQDFYPQPGMRQMCDIDVLFDASSETKVRDWFVSLGYTVKSYGTGNVDSYIKNPFYNFEMHRALTGMMQDKRWTEYYSNVYQRLQSEDNTCRMRFSDADLYVYLLMHMYKHYYRGGTGLRSLLDLYVFLKAKGEELNWQYINGELSKLGLAEFGSNAASLCMKIFSDPAEFEVSELTLSEREFLNCFLLYGTYGTVGNMVRNTMKEMSPDEKEITLSTRVRYLWRRIFPSAEVIKEYFPFFRRHRWLLPAGYLYRLVYRSITNFKKMKAELTAVRKAQ